MDALPVYNDRYIKSKIRTYNGKVSTNFCGLNVPEDGLECDLLKSFPLIPYLFMKTNITCKYV